MIVTFASRKGGVGKTTSAVNVAASLATMGHRTLLIDADPQASASISLGFQRNQLSPSLVDAFERNTPLAELARSTIQSRLELVTGSADLGPMAIEHGFSRTDELRLRHVLERHAGAWDHVVIDSPPGQTLLSRNALAASDVYVVPAVPHFLAVEGIEQLFGIVQRLGRRCHVSPRCIGVLPTMVDKRARSVRDMLTTLEQQFGALLFATEIPHNIRIAEAPAYGKTVFLHAPDCRGAIAYTAATHELISRIAGPAPVINRDDQPAAGSPHPAEVP